ncbi:THUMP domain-containing protein 2-like [Neocloeon triangulifer]|uniref:THUMP domain-containing protein 2-like n=1 Tax=Neocloeon triangulifer TaxID=2078957 RepID=UPI00286EE165|nr:THUMP domain-containing protein 2-like [Neocloeon triangulifer]
MDSDNESESKSPLTQPDTGDLMSLYCTLGRGMHPFVLAELAQMNDVRILKRIEGSIFFSVPSTLGHKELILKTAERTLVMAYHDKQTIDPDIPAPAGILQLQKILTEKIDWDKIFEIWIILKGSNPKMTEKVTARLNIKSTGKMRKIFKPERIASCLCRRLKRMTKSMDFVTRGAEMSIDLKITDSFLTVGVALTSTSQASGGKDYGLRSTTASAMAMCLTINSESAEFFKDNIVKGSIVLDPMCGKGSIPSVLSSEVVRIGTDCDPAQVNIAKRVPGALLLLADGANLPFKPEFIDHIVCDLPFGLKFNKDNVTTLVPSVLKETFRVLKYQGKAIFLFSKSERDLITECAQSIGLNLITTFEVMLGVLQAVIYVFKKSIKIDQD